MTEDPHQVTVKSYFHMDIDLETDRINVVPDQVLWECNHGNVGVLTGDVALVFVFADISMKLNAPNAEHILPTFSAQVMELQNLAHATCQQKEDPSDIPDE